MNTHNINFHDKVKCFLQYLYVPDSDSRDILFLSCLYVGLTALTLVITFEPFEI